MTDPRPAFSQPVPLTAAHHLADFQSGEAVLDEWLQKRAIQNMEAAASKTYVICPDGTQRVIGFYAICMGQILNQEATGSMRRNMPRLIPAVILGRLAIDKDWQGQGLGQALLNDVVLRSVRAAGEISARLLIVHAISPAAETFYLHHGFTRLPIDVPTFALDLTKLKKASG